MTTVLVFGRGRALLCVLVLVALFFMACTPQFVPVEEPLKDEGVLYLYLQPMPQEAHQLEFSITGISAIREDGGSVRLMQSFEAVSCKELLTRQKRLATTRLAPGLYKGLSLEIGTASLYGEAGKAPLLVPEAPLFVEHEFTIIRKRAHSLFLVLDPEKQVTKDLHFSPAFSLVKPHKRLTSLLGFVTNSGKNLVSVFNKMTMQIVDTIATSSGPKGIALDQRKGWVYIALAGDSAIEVIDVSTLEMTGRIPLNFSDEPAEIALSPNGRTLVTANTGSNTMSIIDTNSLREVGRVSLPWEPTSVVVGRSNANAFVTHSLSNAVSRVDLASRSLSRTQIFEESPVRAAPSKDGNRLYIITANSPDVLVVDPESLALIERIFIGLGATSIKVDSKSGLTYVGNDAGSIAVINPLASMFVDTFKVRGDVAFVNIDNDQNALFAVLPESSTVRKLDLGSKRDLGVIEVEEGAYAVSVMGER